MSSIGTGYDLSAGQFSPDGRIFQIEYAQKAVDNSGTVIALRGSDGVVFAVEKLITSKLHDKGTNSRTFTIDGNIGCVVGGLITDARVLVKNARDEAINFLSENGEKIELPLLKSRVGLYMHAHTLYSSVRPFGACLLLGSWNEHDGAQLYCIDPSGTSYGYSGIAIGKGKQSARTEIEKLKFQKMTCKELIREAAKIIYIVHDEIKDKQFELELSWVGSFTNGQHKVVPKEIFEEAEEYAKAALRRDSDSEDDEKMSRA